MAQGLSTQTIFRALARGGGARVWLGEHSLLVKAVGAALVVWILVGLASALDGQPARTPTAGVVSSSHRPARTRTAKARPAVSAPSVASARRAAGSPRAHQVAHHGETPHLDRRRAPVIEATAAPERVPGQTSAPSSPPAPRIPANAPAAPAVAQTQGGPFSP